MFLSGKFGVDMSHRELCFILACVCFCYASVTFRSCCANFRNVSKIKFPDAIAMFFLLAAELGRFFIVHLRASVGPASDKSSKLLSIVTIISETIFLHKISIRSSMNMFSKRSKNYFTSYLDFENFGERPMSEVRQNIQKS